MVNVVSSSDTTPSLPSSLQIQHPHWVPSNRIKSGGLAYLPTYLHAWFGCLSLRLPAGDTDHMPKPACTFPPIFLSL